MKRLLAALAFSAAISAAASAQEPGPDAATFIERSCGAETIQEGVACLAATLPPESLTQLVGLPYQELALTHWGLGMYVRNRWGLWDGRTPLVQAFRAGGYSNPDDMSGVLISGVWLMHHGCAADFEARLQWRREAAEAAEADQEAPPWPEPTCPAVTAAP